MPFFTCGYYMEQAKFRKVIPKTFEDDEDDDPQWLLRDKDRWWYRLDRDVRAKIPLPGIYLPPGCERFEEGVIWVPSRRRIESDAPEGPGENEDDKRVKEQFLDALCGALAAEDMIYFTILLGPAIRR